MGYLLYREVRDRAPEDWTPTERLVAWIIADDANDKTRKSWIKLPEIMQRAGIRTESGVRQALQRLAARGFEFRVPIGTGKDGRPVFAAKGHSLDFLVPLMPERQLPAVAFEPGNPREDLARGSRGSHEDSPPEAPKATVMDAKGDCAESPLSSAPHLRNQDKASRHARTGSSGTQRDIPSVIRNVRRAVERARDRREAQLVTDDEAVRLYAKLVCGRDVDSPVSYLARVFEDAHPDALLSNAEDACYECLMPESNCKCPVAA